MRWRILFLSVVCGACAMNVAGADEADATSTQWRDDGANLEAVRKINEAYQRMPFGQEFEGMLDDCPLQLTWQIGPNVPVAWKGGVAGIIGDEIMLTGGLWMPERANLTYAYHIEKRTYRSLPPPPERPQYTQGACDGRSLFVVGGRGTGRRVFELSKDASGQWAWSDMPSLPEEEGDGRWLATVDIIPGKWLFLVSGHPTGTPSERRDKPPLVDYRLRLNETEPKWERMSPYPGRHRALVQSGVVGGKLYLFGGSHPDPVMRANHQELAKKYQLRVPYNGVPNFRDAYEYDPETNTWKTIRSLPFPIFAGHGVTLKDRYILLMGSADYPTHRRGRSKERKDPFWTGYGDRILCYDVEQDNYSHVGAMPYGVATSHWVCDGQRVYSFGGEPAHGYNMNTENVLQIGTIQWKP